MKLLILKPLHVKWLIDLYNYMSLPDGEAVLFKGWKAAGITEAVQKGLNGLLSLDPFYDKDPLSLGPTAEDKNFQNDHDEEDEEQWSMYIHEGEEEDTGTKGGLTQTKMLLIYLKLTIYFTKTLKQNTL